MRALWQCLRNFEMSGSISLGYVGSRLQKPYLTKDIRSRKIQFIGLPRYLTNKNNASQLSVTENSEFQRKAVCRISNTSSHSSIKILLLGITDNVPVLEVFNAPLSQFELATADLADLIQHVSGFVDWCAEVKTSLENLEMVLPQIKVDGTNPFRTDTVKERWIQVYQNYVSFQRQVRRSNFHATQK